MHLFASLQVYDKDVVNFCREIKHFPDPIPVVRSLLLKYRDASVRFLFYWSLWYFIVSVEVTDVLIIIRGEYLSFCTNSRFILT